MPIGGKAGKAVLALAAACLAALTSGPLAAQTPAGGATTLHTALAAVQASSATRQIAEWVLESGDNAGRPFAIIDKRHARLVVFESDGRIAGAAPALLGLAPGDDAVPGLGQRDPRDIAPFERTTPAGRFGSEPGRNLDGEDVVWFDYDAGLAIHRLRPGPSLEHREQRLASATPGDNKASLGCVVVAPAFYEQVVKPLLGRRYGVVYVLPETRPAQELFGAWQVVGR